MQVENIQVKSGLDPSVILGNILGFILWIAAFIGVGLLIYGIGQLVQAYQEKAPDAMQKGLICCFAGGILIGLKVVLTVIGVV